MPRKAALLPHTAWGCASHMRMRYASDLRVLHAGDSWAHAATSRVILYWQEQSRCAYLYKSPSLPARTAEYVVTSEGVRGHRPPKRARPSGM